MSDKCCPNCGHCPTCGRSSYPRVVGPYWYWNPWQTYPYGTGDWWTGSGTFGTTDTTITVNSN